MSETKKEQPKTLNDLKVEYSKMLRIREGMPGNADKMRAERKAEKATKEAEMNAAKARALKPDLDAKVAAVKKANEQNQATLAHIKAKYEDEIKPAAERRDALIAEAQKDLSSKIESARVTFNKAAEGLHGELKGELDDIATKYVENATQLEKQYCGQIAQVDAELSKLKGQIDKLEVKVEKKEKPAEASA
jgi:hypothetical protein